MLKKILLGVVLMVLIVGGVFVYRELQQKPEIQNTLSERSQQFIKTQQGTHSELDTADFTGPTGEDTRGKRIGKDGCYSFVTPYRISSVREEKDSEQNECFKRFSFDSPKGMFVVYIETRPISSWDDVGGVSFRRRKTDEYSEEMKTINGKQFLMFKTKDQLYEKNVFYYTPKYSLTFNVITKTNENLDKDVETILASLQVEK